jgi:hypothetical protein
LAATSGSVLLLTPINLHEWVGHVKTKLKKCEIKETSLATKDHKAPKEKTILPGEKGRWSQKCRRTPLRRRKTERGLEKRLAKWLQRKTIMNNTRASRGPETQWEIPIKDRPCESFSMF